MPSITITTSPKTILSYIQALGAPWANAQGACTWLTVRGHDTNGGQVYVGDCNLTSSDYDILLNAGDSRTWNNGNTLNNVSLIEKFIMGSAAGQIADIDFVYT